MRWITPESLIKLAKSMGNSLSNLTHGLERIGEARGPESLIFAQLPPSFNMNGKSLAILSYVGIEA